MDAATERTIFEQFTIGYQSLRTKGEKMFFLDELMKKILPGLQIAVPHRKSLLRRFGQRDGEKVAPGKKVGRKVQYGDLDLRHLRSLWVMNNFACGKRLKPALADWLRFYQCSDEIKKRLTTMSAATIDRKLHEAREHHRKENACATVGQKAHIRRLIKLREPGQIADRPGFVETDTVVHCGDSIAGNFGNTITATDLFSGWTEARMSYGKNAEKVVQGLKEIESALPFTMLALYFDNGSEFVNHLLVEQFAVNRQNNKIGVARGRAGKSNDQCHVEQKNNTFIRHLLGYDRIEKQHIIDSINDLYANEWSQLNNHFLCQMKLKEKDRVGNKTHRKYDTAKTPYQRLMESAHLSENEKEKLRAKHERLNPIHLHGQVQKKLAVIYKMMKEAEIEARTS